MQLFTYSHFRGVYLLLYPMKDIADLVLHLAPLAVGRPSVVTISIRALSNLQKAFGGEYKPRPCNGVVVLTRDVH